MPTKRAIRFHVVFSFSDENLRLEDHGSVITHYPCLCVHANTCKNNAKKAISKNYTAGNAQICSNVLDELLSRVSLHFLIRLRTEKYFRNEFNIPTLSITGISDQMAR